MIRSLEKRVPEHSTKIEQATTGGGKTSSMEREVRAWKDQIQAARDLLNRVSNDR
jgi:hypothetical protein